MWRKLLLLLVLIPGVAGAAVPAIPGDGVAEAEAGTYGSCGAGLANAFVNLAGTLATGCDLLADAPDQDRDGYTSDGTTGTSGSTAIDCDDTDRRIYPGEYVGTGGTLGAPTGYKLCHATNGTYNTNVLNATTPLCESPGGVTHCFYVDATVGVDAANNCQTYATPCATLAKLSGGAPTAAGLPASPITLAADDFVYYKSGVNSTTFTMDVGGVASIPVLWSPGASGTSGHPITLRQYPGFQGTQVLANGVALHVGQKSFITIDGIMGSSAWTSLTHSGSFIAIKTADNLTVKNVYATALLHGDNNGACIKQEESNRSNIHHNFLRDCSRTTGNVDNVSAVEWLDNEGASQGADHSGHHNVIWYSSYSNTVNGSCWFEKHGTFLSDVGTNGHPVTYSYCISPRRAFFWSGSGLRFKGNFIYNDGAGHNVSSSAQYIGLIDDGGTGGYHEDNRVQYNTYINSSMLYWRIPIYSGTPGLTIDHNIFVDNDASYSTGNDEGMISIDPYGSDAQRTSMAGYLTSNTNIFYNGAATLVFSHFQETSGGHGPAGAAGGSYSFANWQSNSGEDAGSFVEDPSHNSQYECASAHCSPSTIGWLAATEAAAGGGGGPSIAQLQTIQAKKKKRGGR